jgi:pimeloyl-ACP methyl ester carboxylesterase
MNIPFLEYGNSGQELIFLHANGYPPECYLPLIKLLSNNYRILAIRQRPLWAGSDPQELATWHPLTGDFLRFLDERQAEASIVVGHSVGGIVALRAALTHPGRIRALVLIDPVLFPPYVIFSWKVFRALGFGYYVHPLVRTTRQRRREFDDLDRLFQGFRRKPVFRYFGDEELRSYIEGIACPGAHGYQLCYSVDWEMRIYVTSVSSDMDLWRGLPGLKIPLLIIRGAETDTFWNSTAGLVQRKDPAACIESIPRATHLVPLEQPGEVSREIHSFFQEML